MGKITEGSLTRRDFARVAVGAFASLPRVLGLAGAYLVPINPSTALAEEMTQEEAGVLVAGGQAKIVIIKPTELAITLYDVSKEPPSLLEGASITLTSFFNNQILTATTDDIGTAIFDVEALSEDSGKSLEPKEYHFYGSIKIRKEGYRQLDVNRHRFNAGVPVPLGTRPLAEARGAWAANGSSAYPKSISFDDYDIFSMQNTFTASPDPSAAVDHTLSVVLADVPDGEVNLQLVANASSDGSIKEQVIDSTKATASGNEVTLTMQRQFLFWEDNEGTNKYLLPEERTFCIRFTTSQSGETYTEAPLRLVVARCPLPDRTKPEVYGDRQILPFDPNDTSTFDVVFPDSIPILGGSKIESLFIPQWYVMVYADPAAWFCVSVTAPHMGYYRDNGTIANNDPTWAWFHPQSSVTDQLSSFKNDLADLRQAYQDNRTARSNGTAGSYFQQTQFLHSISFGCDFSAMAYMEMNPEALEVDPLRMLAGQIFGKVDVGGSVTLTETFCIGPVPILIDFGVSADFILGIAAAFVSGEDFKDARWDYGSTGLTFRIRFAISLSLGVGLRGFLSASLRGSFTLSYFVGFESFGTAVPGLKNPHQIFGISVGLEVVVGVLWFTYSFNIKQYDKPELVNNWKKGSSGLLGDESDGNLPTSLAGLADDLKIVTDASLGALAEFSSQGFANDGFAWAPASERRQPAWRKRGACPDATSYLRRHVVTNDIGEGVQWFEPVSKEEVHAARAANVELGDLIPVWEGKPPAVTRIVRDNLSHRFECGPVGVVGLAGARGVKPTSDIDITGSVLDDHHSKVVSIWNQAFVLRLASVDIEGTGGTRTRILAQEVSHAAGEGLLFVLDFDLSVPLGPRDEFFDYDFDVVADTVEYEEDGATIKRRDLHILILSGIRWDGDNTSFVDAGTDTLCSYVRWSFVGENQFDVDHQTVSCVGVDPLSIVSTTDDQDWWHMYSSPQIKLIENGGDKHVAMSFFDRAGAQSNDVLAESGNNTLVGMGMFFANAGKAFGEITVPTESLNQLRSVISGMNDLSMYGSSWADALSDGTIVVHLDGESAHYLTLSASTMNANVCLLGENEFTAVAAPTLSTINVASCAELAWNESMKLVAVPGRDYFLTAAAQHEGEDPQLMRADVSGSTIALTAGVGPENFSGASFDVHASLDGELYLYWGSGNEGKEPCNYDDDGNVLDRADVKEYQIMAARMRGDRFSYPFVLAGGLDHAVDTIRVLEDDSRTCMSLLTTQTVHAANGDVQSGEGNVHFVVVPHVVCASIADAQAATPAMPAGATLPFYVAVRNDGNTYLRGLTVQLAIDEDGQRDTVIAEAVLTFSADSIVASKYNPTGDDGTLQYVEDDYALAPGSASLYRVVFAQPDSTEVFTIPSDWWGYYNLLVTIKPDSVVMAETEQLRLANAYRHVVRAQSDGNHTMQSAADKNGVYLSSIGDNALLVAYEPANEEMTKLVGDGTRVPAGQASLTVKGQAVAVSPEGLSTMPLTVVNTRGTTGAGGTSAKPGSSGSDARKTLSKTPSKTLPKTGDSSSTLPAALGVVGAALLAYSHRRETIEKEREDD